MDATDRQILALLQEDATMPVAEIARKVGLSATPCWRRIQKLEEAKIIRRRVALVDSRKVNVGVTAFVFVRTSQHGLEWLERFADAVRELPEVVEFYRMSGQVDYLLRVVVPDIEAYDRFYKKLIGKIELSDVSSSFAMEQIKYTTALPLDYAWSGWRRRRRGLPAEHPFQMPPSAIACRPRTGRGWRDQKSLGQRSLGGPTNVPAKAAAPRVG